MADLFHLAGSTATGIAGTALISVVFLHRICALWRDWAASRTYVARQAATRRHLQQSIPPDSGRSLDRTSPHLPGRRPVYEHMLAYMMSDGSPYSRLPRAIRNGNLAVIHATVAELGWVPLREALAILMVIEATDHDRFDKSAVRCAGRLALEVPDLELAELAGAIESLVALPDEQAQRSLLAMAERVRPRPPAVDVRSSRDRRR